MYLKEPVRFGVDDLQRLLAKDVHDRRGENRPDPADHARAEIDTNRPFVGGHDPFALFSFELPSVTRVVDPIAVQSQTFSGPYTEERPADRRNALLLTHYGGQPQHRALVVADVQQMIDDALDHVGGIQGDRVGHRRHLHG